MIPLSSTLIKEEKAVGKLAQFVDEAIFRDLFLFFSILWLTNHNSRHIMYDTHIVDLPKHCNSGFSTFDLNASEG